MAIESSIHCRHKHHIRTRRGSSGFFDSLGAIFTSKPGTPVGVFTEQISCLDPPFQSEISLLSFNPKNESLNSVEGSSNLKTTSLYAAKQTSRPPHSRTSTTSKYHPNILYPLLFSNCPTTSISPSLPKINLKAVIHQTGRMSAPEADCYFKQIIRGLNHLHNIGLAHLNVHPEVIIVSGEGRLQISGFENAERFREEWEVEQDVRKLSKRCGKMEYVAPEVFLSLAFDGRKVDLWATGVMYLEMRNGRRLWDLAAQGADEAYDQYLSERASLWGYRPLENIANDHCRTIIKSLLDPDSKGRLSAPRVLKSSWCIGSEVCEAASNVKVQ